MNSKYLRKLYLRLTTLAIVLLIITPFPMGLFLAIATLLIPFKLWPHDAQLIVRCAKIKTKRFLRNIS